MLFEKRKHNKNPGISISTGALTSPFHHILRQKNNHATYLSIRGCQPFAANLMSHNKNVREVCPPALNSSA